MPWKAWETFRRRTPRQRLVALLRPAFVRWTLLLGLLAAISGWIWFLLPVAVYALSRMVSWIVERLLWSVRAKLGAFYLHAAVVPLLLFATILALLGYLVLWNISARVVERRLLQLVNWSEQGITDAEHSWWRARAGGAGLQEAARRAVESGWGAAPPGVAVWVRRAGSDSMLVSAGALSSYAPLRPAWLGQDRFAGLATPGVPRHLELRTSALLQDAAGRIEIGSALRVDTAVLNRGLPDPTTDVHGDVGGPERALQQRPVRSDSLIIASGILALVETPASDSLAAADSTVAPGLERSRIVSRFPVLLGHYQGHPVDWRNGRTRDGGPPILIAFSVEAGIDALLATSYEAQTVVVWAALTVMATLVFLFLFATVRGLLYARSIAASVTKLDQGVRAIQTGDFGFRIEPREKDQLGELARGFNGMASQLQELLEEQAAHRVVEREIEIARTVQSRLFPQESPHNDSMQAIGVCVPARSVSGDSYDFIRIARGWDLVVADVSGKGVSAALLMAGLHAALRAQYGAAGETPPDPARALEHVNRHLGAWAEPTRFVTLFLVRFEGTRKLVYCNAGHNPALHVQAHGVSWLTEGGLMLGPFPDRPYRRHEIDVDAGDLVCLYTDGVTEAMDPDGAQFGEERLARLLQGHRSEALEDIRAALLEGVRAWRRGGAASDDVTFVLLRILSTSG